MGPGAAFSSSCPHVPSVVVSGESERERRETESAFELAEFLKIFRTRKGKLLRRRYGSKVRVGLLRGLRA